MIRPTKVDWTVHRLDLHLDADPEPCDGQCATQLRTAHWGSLAKVADLATVQPNLGQLKRDRV